jgi:hypothetical protein
MIKQKPILFSTQMVRAILEGRKTQTRRLFPYQYKVCTHNNKYQIEYMDERDNQYYTRHIEDICKYGKIGDRLWVKETYAMYGENSIIPYEYKANFKEPIDKFWKWKPSIFMPRKASRITLEITNIRVERLNDISEEDAIAEGVEYINSEGNGVYYKNYKIKNKNWMEFKNPIDSYHTLWESINGKNSWRLDPLVWVIEFKKILGD